MAFTPPTAADLKARFPIFEAEDVDTINFALSEAELMVDDSWNSQADFTLGRMLYAGHILTLEGYGTGAEAKLGATGAFGFQTIQSGKLRLTRRSDGAATDPVLQSTMFGQRFRDLLKRNRCGPLVANVST
jgi:hypothetical protein